MKKTDACSFGKISYKNFNILVYDSLESTNKTAKELAVLGDREGTIVVALSQTKGRGRGERSFYSPKESGIYFSIILRPDFPPKNLMLITPAAAVAVCRVVEKLSNKKPFIKWVNDVFVDGKKVCGILTESVFSKSGAVDFTVLGIGINLFIPEDGFPTEIKDIAGGIFENGITDFREQMVKEILDDFFDIYSNILSLEFVKEYKAKQILMGREITFIKSGENIKARVVDLTESCGLVVEKEDGEREVLSTGEVTIGSGSFTE